MSDDLPAFLRIDAATRALAWAKSPPQPWPKFAEVRREEEPATRELREQLAYQDSAKAAREGQRLRALAEEKAAEKAELAGVRERAIEAKQAAQVAPRVRIKTGKKKKATRRKR